MENKITIPLPQKSIITEVNIMSSNSTRYCLDGSTHFNHILGIDFDIWFWIAGVLFVIGVFAIRVLIGIFSGENVLDVLEKSLDDAIDFDDDDDDER